MEDAYGQELWAYFNGKASFEIVERDDGFFDVSLGPELYFLLMNNGPRRRRRLWNSLREGYWTLAAGLEGTPYICRKRASTY
jgi:hypothetical protein